MRDNCRWDEDCRPGGELNNQPAFPENKVAAFFRVVPACRKDGADAKGKVGKVSMSNAASPRAEIDCRRCPDAVVEVSVKLAIIVQEAVEMVDVVPMQPWHPRGERSYGIFSCTEMVVNRRALT